MRKFLFHAKLFIRTLLSTTAVVSIIGIILYAGDQMAMWIGATFPALVTTTATVFGIAGICFIFLFIYSAMYDVESRKGVGRKL